MWFKCNSKVDYSAVADVVQVQVLPLKFVNLDVKKMKGVVMPRVKHCGSLGCHKLVKYPNRYCAQHQSLERDYSIYNKTRNRNHVKTEQYNFYRTKQWVDLRQATLDKYHYLCQYCAAVGAVKPAKIVDHTVPVEYSLDDKANPDNLSVICSACHTAKTKWEQEYYGTGIGNVAKKVQTIKNVGTIKRLFTK